MPNVRLFANLRQSAGLVQLDVDGQTIKAILDKLCVRYPGLRVKIMDGDSLRPFIRILVNGHDIELGSGLNTPVEADDQIAIFPPITGGSLLWTR